MIFLVAPTGETWEFEDYLRTYGKELSGRVSILTWDQIVTTQQLSLGSYIFLALDQLTPTEREIAVQCWQKLSEAKAAITLVNNPSKVLLRYDFLRASFERGHNRFRVHRAAKFLDCRHFPVFLRGELDHRGSLSDLLSTRRHLARAVAEKTLSGFRLRDLIVVEYCHTVSGDGLFRKYSAFIVGDTIIPHTLMHSRDWITKSHGRLIDAQTAREELAYVTGNPHAEWLRQTFALAKIRYGRIDYGVQNGAPQVWEINTNPTIIRHPNADPLTQQQVRLRDPIRHNFFPKFQTALEAIDSTVRPDRTLRISVSLRQQRRLAGEKQLRLRLEGRRTALAWVGNQMIFPLWRAAKRVGLVSGA
jgi:hypothetical protein